MSLDLSINKGFVAKRSIEMAITVSSTLIKALRKVLLLNSHVAKGDLELGVSLCIAIHQCPDI